MPRPDKHTEVELNYLEQGRLTYLFWGERTTVESGRPALFWATTSHQIVEYENVTSYTVITLALPWLLNWAFPRILSSGSFSYHRDFCARLCDSFRYQG